MKNNAIENQSIRFSLHRPYLFNFALLNIRNPDVADDLVQETLTIALERAAYFKQQCTERTWLIAILKKRIYLFFRKERYKYQIIVAGDEHSKDIADMAICNQAIPTDVVYYKELKMLIAKCVMDMPHLWQSVYLLKVEEECNADEICKRLQISSSYYWVICHRLKTELSRFLQLNWN